MQKNMKQTHQKRIQKSVSDASSNVSLESCEQQAAAKVGAF